MLINKSYCNLLIEKLDCKLYGLKTRGDNLHLTVLIWPSRAAFIRLEQQTNLSIETSFPPVPNITVCSLCKTQLHV